MSLLRSLEGKNDDGFLFYRQAAPTELGIGASRVVFDERDNGHASAHAESAFRLHFSITDTAKLLEKALLEQAGVVITRLDDKKASVTWNDRLPTNVK